MRDPPGNLNSPSGGLASSSDCGYFGGTPVAKLSPSPSATSSLVVLALLRHRYELKKKLLRSSLVRVPLPD